MQQNYFSIISNYILLLLCLTLRSSKMRMLIHALAVTSVFMFCSFNHHHLLSPYDPFSYSITKMKNLYLLAKFHTNVVFYLTI